MSFFLLAYVDPGIVGLFFQSIYAFLFGAASMWILRPWRWLRSLGQSKPRPVAADDAAREQDDGDDR